MEEKDNKKLLDLNTVNLPTNTPKYYKDYEPYADILSKKIEDPDVKNIGIVAPYGAGKSSLIKTFIDMEERKKASDCRKSKSKNELKFEDEVISISLANYSSIVRNIDESSNKNNEDNKVKEATFEDYSDEENNAPKHENYTTEQEIEKSILQQLFYKNNNDKTPASRFKVLKDNNERSRKLTFSTIGLIVSVLFLSFQFYDNIFRVFATSGWKWAFISLALAISVATSVLILYDAVHNRYIKSIQVGDFHFEKNENESISIFNQYIDEIIYFFQKNDFKILIIEDLDRFNNLEIFSKLKELNTLLNNNDSIKKKHGKITFLYAVKDSMFRNEEERSKFFEFILPVIPSITSENVKDELSKELCNQMGLKDIPLSSQLVVDISDYISSRRILNNIISDFLIHLSILKIDYGEQKKLDKLFSLMVLKNVLPLEYERLQSQNNKSVIYSIINTEKEKVQNDLINSLKTTIREKDAEINDINTEQCNTIKELKILLTGALFEEDNGFRGLNSSIESFKNLKDINCKFYHPYHSTVTKNIELKKLEKNQFGEEGYFINRENIIKNKTKSETDRIIKERNDAAERIHLINNMTFSELYNLYSDMFTKVKFHKKLIKLLLIYGYIDETHMDYLSVHSNSFTSSNDKNIKKRINLKDKIDVFENVDSPKNLIIILDKNKFNSHSVLNYYIVKELVLNSRSYKEKYELFIDYLKRNPINTKCFIEEIVNSGKDIINILVKLLKEIPQIWDWIYNSDIITDEHKELVQMNIINDRNITIKNLQSMNADSKVELVINDSLAFCNKFYNPNFKIEDLSKAFKLNLKTLFEFTRNPCSTYVLDNDLYKFSYANIKTILRDYYNVDDKLIDVQNYDCIRTLNNSALKNRVNANINEYVEEIYSTIQEGKLSPEGFLELLINDNISDELKKSIVSKETSEIEYCETINSDIVEVLLDKKQIKLTLDNIISLIDNVSQTKLGEYINEHHTEIEITEELIKSNDDFRRFFFDYTDLTNYVNNIGKEYTGILEIENDDNIALIIKNKLCLYDVDDFAYLADNRFLFEEYCKLFPNEINKELKDKKVKFVSEVIVAIYFVAKKLKLVFFSEIIKYIDAECLDLIIKEEPPLTFIRSIEDFNILSNSCKEVLLRMEIDVILKEKILCTMKDYDTKQWLNLMKKTLGIDSKYFTKNEIIYPELKRRNVNCKKIGFTIKFHE